MEANDDDTASGLCDESGAADCVALSREETVVATVSNIVSLFVLFVDSSPARSLVLVTSTPEAAAYDIMMGAHRNGVASVGVFVREVGECYVEGLGERGVSASLRPVEE